MKSLMSASYYTCALWMSVQKNSWNAVDNMLSGTSRGKGNFGSIFNFRLQNPIPWKI